MSAKETEQNAVSGQPEKQLNLAIDKRKPRSFKTAPLDLLHHAANVTERDVRDIAEIIGYSRSAVADWLQRSQMPLVAHLACKLLILELTQGKNRVILKGENISVVDGEKTATLTELYPGTYLLELS